jgi:hypothetical protein
MEVHAMGVDVYAVIEYKEYNTYWSFGELNLPRDVRFLSAIAWGEGGVIDEMPHPPRGIPSDCSTQVREAFYINPEEVLEYLVEAGSDEEGDESSLEEYIAGHGEWAVAEYAATGLVPQPELTGYGSLNLIQLRENLAHAKVKTEDLTPACRAAIATMESLATSVGADQVRLVFWLGM